MTAITKSSKIATVVVVIMVALVLALLYESFLPGTSTTTDNQVSILNATLYSGSPSTQSFTSSCTGDAVLSVELYNPMSVAIHITNVTLYGSSLKGNATIFVSLSNSCLSISEYDPTLSGTSSNNFFGYASVALQFGQAYTYAIQFDNGQRINQSLLAQAE
jgi:hypothetical protein